MKTLMIIGFGGFLGSICRYLLAGLTHTFFDLTFPLGTLLVNFIGAFLIGYFMEFSLTRSFFSDSVRLFIVIGLLGGFTTFSTFSYETISLLKSGNYTYAFLNILLTNILCLSGTLIGIKLTSTITSS